MLRDGLYRIAAPSQLQPKDAYDDVFAVIRSGRIFASDRTGGVYVGAAFANIEFGSWSLAMKAKLPPGRELITGASGGAHGAIIEITGCVRPDCDRQTATLDVGGAPVQVEIWYLGPLLH